MQEFEEIGAVAPAGVVQVPLERAAFSDTSAKLETNSHTPATEALRLEHHLSDLVNAAYHLKPDEIALLWHTAPPRMPSASARCLEIRP